jgi:hypothetical protein
MHKHHLIITLFALLVCLAGCSDGTSAKQSKLVGTWKEDDGSTFTLRSDGSFSGTGKTGSWGVFVPTEIVLTGTWRLAGDDLVLKVTHSNHAQDKLVGMEISETVTDVDRNSFRSVNNNGKQNVYTRVN